MNLQELHELNYIDDISYQLIIDHHLEELVFKLVNGNAIISTNENDLKECLDNGALCGYVDCILEEGVKINLFDNSKPKNGLVKLLLKNDFVIDGGFPIMNSFDDYDMTFSLEFDDNATQNRILALLFK